jgi:hypothetical protein
MIEVERVIKGFEKGIIPSVGQALMIRNGNLCGCAVGALYLLENEVKATEDNIEELDNKANLFVDSIFNSPSAGAIFGMGFDDGFSDYEFDSVDYGSETPYRNGFRVGKEIKEWYNNKREGADL